MKKMFLALLLACLSLLEADVTVNSTLDNPAANPAVSPDSTAGVGVITLRSAIEYANSFGGWVPGDTIGFNIAGSGVQQIQPATPLPQIVKRVVIDGYTQPGTSENTQPTATHAILLIEINGNSYAVNGSGLSLGSGSAGSTIRGLVINEWKVSGIYLDNSPGSRILGNFIGTSSNGFFAQPNAIGILINTPSIGVIIGTIQLEDRNLIGGSFDQTYNPGACILSYSNNALIKGNMIGLTAQGWGPLGNSAVGIRLIGGTGNRIGGVTPREGNVISGQTRIGVWLDSSSSNFVQRNFIGTDATGYFPIGNKEFGLLFTGTSTAPALNNNVSDNVISANGTGVKVDSPSFQVSFTTNRNVFVSNFIGTDLIGSKDLGNKNHGMWFNDGACADVSLSTISANGKNGILISGYASDLRMLSNTIGTDATATLPLGNGENGIQIGTEEEPHFTSNNRIGYIDFNQGPINQASANYTAPFGNVISANGKNGILVIRSDCNSIQGNWIGGTNVSSIIELPNGEAGIKLIYSNMNTVFGNTIQFNPKSIVTVGCDICKEKS